METQKEPRSLDELLAVKFKWSLMPSSIRDMFRFVSEEKNLAIRYSEKVNTNITPSKQGVNTEKYTEEVNGLIIGKESPYIPISFSLTRGDPYKGDFIGLRFFCAPGYDIEEMSSEFISELDKVRVGIDNYFDSNTLVR